MRYYDKQVVFQEVPNEISLAYSITGCKVGCKGCHSAFTWNENTGTELTPLNFAEDLEKLTKIEASDFLHASTFLHHNRPWSQTPEMVEKAKTRVALSTTAVSTPDGVAIPNSLLEENLVQQSCPDSRVNTSILRHNLVLSLIW